MTLLPVTGQLGPHAGYVSEQTGAEGARHRGRRGAPGPRGAGRAG